MAEIGEVLGLMISAALALPGPDSKPGGATDAVRQLAQSSCVQVASADKNNRGSGALIAVRGAFLYILTASHVVSGSDRLEVHLPPINKDGKTKVVTEVDILI